MIEAYASPAPGTVFESDAGASAAERTHRPAHSILYVSRCRLMLESTELERLVSHAQDHNRKVGITGALLCTRGFFAQVLEGERLVVAALMARIEEDPRHHAIAVLRAGHVAERRFGRWSMAYFGESNYTAKQVLDAVHGQDEAARSRSADRLLWMMSEFAKSRP